MVSVGRTEKVMDWLAVYKQYCVIIKTTKLRSSKILRENDHYIMLSKVTQSCYMSLLQLLLHHSRAAVLIPAEGQGPSPSPVLLSVLALPALLCSSLALQRSKPTMSSSPFQGADSDLGQASLLIFLSSSLSLFLSLCVTYFSLFRTDFSSPTSKLRSSSPQISSPWLCGPTELHSWLLVSYQINSCLESLTSCNLLTS